MNPAVSARAATSASLNSLKESNLSTNELPKKPVVSTFTTDYNIGSGVSTAESNAVVGPASKSVKPEREDDPKLYG